MRPAANQTGGKVAQLRELYLQFTFVGARALGEDIKDQSGTVNYPALTQRFQITLLRRR